MKAARTALAGGCCALAALGGGAAIAQSTDGFHSFQVFPVVVDSGSFTQRFTFQNPDPAQAATVEPRYFPGTGTSQPAPIACPTFAIAPGQLVVFTSLRQLCPALATGSQFGYVTVAQADAGNRPFAGFSRISNPAGNGFSVEAFPAHTFTSADAVVTGLRRLAATASAPAFQSNCFLGTLAEVTLPAAPSSTQVVLRLHDRAGAQLGSALMPVSSGRLTRLLDVFAAVGAPPGNYDDVKATFSESGSGEPGLMVFCTVQDNSSFGADFRIAKQALGFDSVFAGPGAQDDHVSRDSVIKADVATIGGEVRAFALPAGSASNTHVMYFRHPDRVACELINPDTGVRAAPSYGLEMRMTADDGETELVGGDDTTGFEPIYLGDKDDFNGGANTRYTIEVERNGSQAFTPRAYWLHCRSGSGHSAADMVRYQEPVDRF